MTETTQLPPLNGTAKQVAWAETIRAGYLAQCPPGLAAALTAKTAAKFWIENRNHPTWKAVYGKARGLAGHDMAVVFRDEYQAAREEAKAGAAKLAGVIAVVLTDGADNEPLKKWITSSDCVRRLERPVEVKDADGFFDASAPDQWYAATRTALFLEALIRDAVRRPGTDQLTADVKAMIPQMRKVLATLGEA